MFVLLWPVVLVTLRHAGVSAQMERHCNNGFCVTLNTGEVTSEDGLCVVVPCTFSAHPFFGGTFFDFFWYKCEASNQACSASDEIFHTTKNKRNTQAGLKGRVSLLEPDLNLNNCSIIINDLQESDSGFYQLKVFMGQMQIPPHPASLPGTNVVVRGLSQKPTLTLPLLTEGQRDTLSCTAPGLCSGSPPNITWTWKRLGENHTHIAGSLVTESVGAVTQRHSSALTFTSSVEDHGASLTCRVTYAGGATTEETVTLNVTHVKEVEISGRLDVREGEALNLTCSVESFPPSLVTWTKTCPSNKVESYTQEGSGVATLFIPQVAAEHAGQYVCRVEHLNTTLMEEVDVTVVPSSGNVVLPWTLAAASLALNVAAVSYVVFLRSRRRREEAAKEPNNTYMSLRKPEMSAEYDVIAPVSK